MTTMTGHRRIDRQPGRSRRLRTERSVRALRAGAAAVLFGALLVAGGNATEAAAAGTWRELAPGLDLARFPARQPAAPGDSGLVILRIDPARWDLGLYCAARDSAGETRTAREWCRALGLTAAINAGMYTTDYRTHVGYLRAEEFRGGGVVRSYRSVAVFGPREATVPEFRIHDLEEDDFDLKPLTEQYRFVVQNLRLIRRPGVNVWQESGRRWSEAALGEDSAGRALFIFCRTPHTMPELNRILLRLPIGLVAAQHLEGGPEAQLYLESGGARLDLFGSFETGFRDDDANPAAWPVPNVIGIRPRVP